MPAFNPGISIVGKGFPGNGPLNPVDGIENVIQRVAEFTRHLENSNSRLFDAGPQPGMQAVPCRHIHGDMQLLLEKQLYADQIESIKPAPRIIIDKQIQIAVVAGVISNRGTKHVKRGRAHAPYGIGGIPQSPDRIRFLHGA